MLALPPVAALSLGGMSFVLSFALWKLAQAKRFPFAPNS